MAEEVGGAVLTVGPSVKGFGAKLSSMIAPQLAKSGRRAGEQLGDGISRGARSRLRSGSAAFAGEGERAGRNYGSGINRGFRKGLKAAAIGTAATLGLSGVLGLGGLVKDSVQTEAAFSQRMAQIKVNVADATDSSIGNLGKLAIKLGQDTVFSANDAADAMLELAKGGFRQAQIAGGGVQATMNLAAAEGMGLADAATIVANNMNAYSIKAAQASKITDALAAGSAASTASVTSLADGLSNVGGVARNFGFDINDTVGVLAAFDQNALRGAEGGTALRSLLTHLAGPTKAAKDEMADLGISLSDAHGNFRDITNIAEQFRRKLGGLSQAEQARVSKVIAGAYGQRALNVLVKEGAAGLDKYITATKVQGKAQQLAQARMSGTAGALERLSGAVETGELALGKALAPAVDNLAKYLTNKAVPAVTGFITSFQDGTGSAGELRDTLEQVGGVLGDVFKIGRSVVGVFNDLPSGVKRFAIEGVIAYKVLRLLQGGFVGVSATAAAAGGSLLTKVAVPMQTFDRYTANSVAQQGILQGSLTRTQLNLAGLKGAAVSAAGVGGMLALQQSTQQTSKVMGGLEGAIGGALTGFAVSGGNPWAALIGGAGGGLLGVFSSGNKAASGIDKAGEAARLNQPSIDALAATVDEVTGAFTRLTKQEIGKQLQTAGAFGNAGKLGINLDTVSKAGAGNPAALKQITTLTNEAIDAQKRLIKVNASTFLDTKTGKSYDVFTKAGGKAVTDIDNRAAAAKALAAALGLVSSNAGKASKKALQLSLASGALAKTLHGAVADPYVYRIATEGDKRAKQDIVNLTAAANLTPKQVKILLQTAGLADSKGAVIALGKEAEAIAKKYVLNFTANLAFGAVTGGNPPRPGGADGDPKTPYPRVLGGSVQKGTPYLVGERRPELFVPNKSGRIESHVKVQPMADRGSTGSAERVYVPTALIVEDIEMGAYVDAKIDDRFERAGL